MTRQNSNRRKSAEGKGFEPSTPCGAPVLQTDAEAAECEQKQHASTLCQQNASSDEHSDPDLQAIIERWPELPEALKTGILAMVRATERK